jgi:glycosyltransferase involved in cell wall biosynthesis
LDNQKKITPYALNLGIENSRGELILWMSAHNVYEKMHISKCVYYLKEYNADAVGGIIRPIPRRNNLTGRAICAGISHPFGVGNSAHKTGVQHPQWADTAFGTCYKREIFEKIGTFNENLKRGQDIEFSLRLKKAGFKTLLVPEIVSFYYTRSDVKAFLKHTFNNGNWVMLPFLYSETMPVSWRHLVPLVFVIGLSGAAILGLAVRSLIWVFLAIVCVYCVANMAASFQIAWRKKDIRYLLVMPLIFLLFHISYGLGSLWGSIEILVTPRLWKRLFGERKARR